jgi:hypothetical protein
MKNSMFCSFSKKHTGYAEAGFSQGRKMPGPGSGETICPLQ